MVWILQVRKPRKAVLKSKKDEIREPEDSVRVSVWEEIQEIEYEMVGKGSAWEGQIIGFHIC